MALVASTIPNLVSGVSQQPAPTRLRTSGEQMVNAYASIVTGLQKRPPSEFIAKLTSGITVSDTSAVHTIDRSFDEKYILVCGDGDLELFDQFGVKQTVTFPDGKSYLPTSDMWRKLRFVSVADTTFVLNTDVGVTASDLTEDRADPSGVASVFIRQAVANVYYAVFVNGVLAAQTQTNNNTSAATSLEGTSDIAEELATDAVSRGYTDAQAIGATLTFSISPGDTITVTDQFGGRALTAYTDTLQEFEDLPPSEVEGRLVRLEGNLDDATASYWVEYSQGIWKEAVGFNARRQLDPETMPHILKKTGSNTFEFRENDWNPRPVGDADSNPDPTFVGSPINGMFLFKGRLGLLSEENVILSATALFEDLYRTTAVQLLASDPIDIASATGRVSTLYHAASFSDELVLFSDKQQFRLSSGNVLSAETVGITNSTSYPCSLYVAPVTVGSSAYFMADGPTNTIAREVFIDGQRETVNGEDIAVQIPSYIPKNIRALSASATSDVFLALSEDEPNSLYVYKWYTAEQKKIQSAWSKWTFDTNIVIVGMGFLDSYLYLVYKRDGEVLIDRINVAPIVEKDLLLDHQLDETDLLSLSYDAMADVTSLQLPFNSQSTLEFHRTDNGSLAPYEGVVKVSTDTYTIPGDVTGHGITGGVNYEFLYEFSKQYLREENSDGESAIQDGRLQLRYFSVIYTDTSYFEAHVTPTNGETKITTFNGRTLADPDNIADVIPRDTGEFKFPVFAQNEEVVVQLVNDKPYRCAFGSVEWTANYRQKARRV